MNQQYNAGIIRLYPPGEKLLIISMAPLLIQSKYYPKFINIISGEIGALEKMRAVPINKKDLQQRYDLVINYEQGVTFSEDLDTQEYLQEIRQSNVQIKRDYMALKL